MQSDKFNVLVRTLTASSIELRAIRIGTEKRQSLLKQGFLTLDGSVAWLGRRRARQEEIEEEREREKEREITQERGVRTPRKVLASRGGLRWLLYLDERLVDIEEGS
jgi:hypothetical protein